MGEGKSGERGSLRGSGFGVPNVTKPSLLVLGRYYMPGDKLLFLPL